MASKLDAALALAARGFAVFPLAAGAKAPPLVRDWPVWATTLPGAINDQWHMTPEANVGVHCDGYLVLDVDPRSGGDESFSVIEDLLPATLTVRTPSGGRHLFFQSAVAVQNSAGRLGPGLDVKSARGYVVGAGSTLPAGEYRIEADLPAAEAPAWLVQKCGVFTERERPAKVDKVVPDAPDAVLAGAVEWLAEQPAGEGAYATACGLRDRGASLAQALALMAEHDPRPNVPEKVEHAYRYAQNEPGARAALPDEFPLVAPEPPKPPRHGGPQRLSALASRAVTGSPYLVKGMLQRQSHAVLYGAPGAGKTFVALDIAYHVAAGRSWHGHRVSGGLALYLAYEGTGGLSRRGAALVRHYGDEDVPLYVQAADFNLREPAGRQALGAVLAALPEKPALIVIDTLARAMKGGDENSAQDMGALNEGVAALIAATGACVMLVHHSGKNKANGARGSSALLGAVDTEIEVDEGAIVATKQRDVETGDPIGFQLHPIMLGVDDDGDEITSCVVMPAKGRSSATRALKGAARQVWETLCDLSPQNAPIAPEDLRRACAKDVPVDNTYRSVVKRLRDTGLLVERGDGHYERRLE